MTPIIGFEEFLKLLIIRPTFRSAELERHRWNNYVSESRNRLDRSGVIVIRLPNK